MFSVDTARGFLPGKSIPPFFYDLRHKKSTVLLTGHSKIFSFSMKWQALLALNGFEIHNIDCAIRFNSYAIANEAIRNNVPPEFIANSITLVRGFTPYQILDAANDILRSFEKNRLFFILAPCKQFFDGDVSFDEGLFLLEKLIKVFRQIKAASIPLVIVEKESYSHPVFSSVYQKIKSLSSSVLVLRSGGASGLARTPEFKHGQVFK
ncbi:MAG: hypothetical protein OEZ22_11135 [Spirochaetia bacterium]|nr:hypothetical protein [Spirochaetia bacterium]